MAWLDVASGVAVTGWSMLMLLLPLLALRFGADAPTIGLLVAAGAVLPLAFAIPIGTYVDRWGARRFVVAGFVGTVVALVPMLISPSLPWLVVAFLLGSAMQNAFIIGAQTLIASLGGAGRAREGAYGWWTTAMSAGQVVGPIVAGVLLDVAGPRAAFAAVIVTYAFAALAMLAVRVSGRTAVAPPPFRVAQGVALLRRRTVGVAIVTSSMGVWAMTAQSTFLPVHLEALSWSAATIGGVLSVRAIASVLVRPFMPSLVALLGGRERAVVFALVALAASLAGVVSLPTVWSVVLWLALFGAGHGLSQPISMVMVADDVDAGERGAAMGLRMTVNRLAQVLAPVSLAWVAVHLGIQAVLVGHAAIVAIVGAGAIYWVMRGRQAR